MNSEIILNRMLDHLRGGLLDSYQSFELVLQILVLAKLSVKEIIPSSLRLVNDKSWNGQSDLTEKLFKIFSELNKCEKLGDNQAAFETSFSGFIDIPSDGLANAAKLALTVAQQEHLNKFDIPEEFYISQLKYSSFIPKEVIEVMSSLVGSLKNRTVYCPYDTLCLIARHVGAQGAKPSAEIPWKSAIPRLINILADSEVSLKISDPLYKPAYTQDGELQKFDISISFPAFGTKVDESVIEEDLFNRFREETSSGSVLTIRHIISQTKCKAVIAVQNSILFSRGAEYTLRRDLLEQKKIEMVISMPQALLPSTPVPFSILVLDLEGNSSCVRFVDGTDDAFSIRDGRNRTKLVHWESLIKTIKNSKDEAISIDIPVEYIFSNDSNLEVSRYLLPQEQKKIQSLLSKETTKRLFEIVEFIRPTKPLAKEKTEGIPVLEIEVSNFPEYGYVTAPTKQILLPSEGLGSRDESSFLQPADILIAIKGSVGRVAIVPLNVPNRRWVASQSCLIMRTKRVIDPRLLFIYLCSDVGQALLRNITSGATVPLIQLKQLKELTVIIPSNQESERIIRTFEEQVQIQDRIKSLQAKLEYLNKAHWSISPCDS